MTTSSATTASPAALARLESSLEANQPYEGHEMFKTVFHRLRSRKQLDDSYTLAEGGAIIQLTKGQVNCGAELGGLLVQAYETDSTPGCEVSVKRILSLVSAFPVTPQGDDEFPPLEACSKLISAALKWLNRVNGQAFAPSFHGAQAAYITQSLGWHGFGAAMPHYAKSSDMSAFAAATAAAAQEGAPAEEDLFITRAALQIAASRAYPEQENGVGRAQAFLEEYSKAEAAGHSLPSTPLVHFTQLFLEALEKRSLRLVDVLTREYKGVIDRDPLLWQLVDKCREVHKVQPPAPAMPGAFGDLFRTRGRASLALALLVLVLAAVESVQGRGLLQDASQTVIQGQISFGGTTSCAIKSSGSAWCWGDNRYGQLGVSTVASSRTLVMVSGGGSWLQISSGYYATCGLKQDSTAWCWGDNSYGQLGTGGASRSGVDYPVAVAGSGTWLQISAGGGHTCGIKIDGSAWCWGDNSSGQLGDKTLANKNIPTMVAGGGTWVQISAGYWHTCGIKADKSAWCWGETYSGKSQPAVLDAPKAVTSNGTWLQISAGFDHTCAIKSDQSLWCWGNSDSTSIVQYLSPNSGVPTPISTATSWLQVSVGSTLVCGITSDFSAWCWGDNADGQVGDGSSGNIKKTPVKVYGGYTWKEVSAGDVYACGITQQRTTMCWGSGSKLGSEGPSANIPRAVAGDGPWGQDQASATSRPPDPSPSSPPPPDNYPAASSSTNVGAIVGGVVGGIAVLAAIAAALIIWRKRRRHSTAPPLSAKPPTMEKAPTRPEDSAALAQSLSSLPSMSASADPVLQWVSSNPTALTHRRSQPPMPSNMASLTFTWPEVRIVRALGLGSFGKVYLGTLNHSPVALKLLIDARAAAAVTTSSATHAIDDTEEAPAVASTDALLAEASILASLRHPNVALLVGYCLNPPCLALEYAARGSLFDVLKKAAADPAAAAELTWKRRLGMAADAAAGMLHLHTRSPPILHRDLKSPNLLVAADWTVKVTDMGLSKVVSEASRNSSATAGGTTNPRWLAPEVINGGTPSEASDVFSFGIVMWEILTFRLPWGDVNVWTIIGSVTSGNRLEIPPLEELPGEKADAAMLEAYVSLMQRCWAHVPEERPSFEVVASELRALGA